MTATGQSRWADALELTAAAAVQDIQHEGMTMLASASGAGVLCDLYASILNGVDWARSGEPIAADASRDQPSPLRVLYVHPGLSPGQAATDRLLNVVERHAVRRTVTPMVVLTEEFTARVPRSRVLHWPDVPSRESGSALERLRRAGAAPFITPTLGTILDSALAAVEAARALRPDVAVFIASAACPVQACMATRRVAPVQINQNIGSPLLVRGVDAVIYRNPAVLRADASELERRGIEGIDLPAAGTDLDAADAARPIDRRSLGVPADAVLFVTAGNKVPERLLMGTFGADLAAFLKRHPKAWWMAIGPGDFTRALVPFVREGTRKRVVLAGPQADIRPHLKAADVYLNEYPEGGSNTVLESMACGVPVLAATPDPGPVVSHCAGIGASIVGEGAVSRGDYWTVASKWCADRASRLGASARALEKARARFGFAVLAEQYESLYLRLAARGAGRGRPEHTHAAA